MGAELVGHFIIYNAPASQQAGDIKALLEGSSKFLSMPVKVL
jgi:hypothetical protein